MKKLKTFYCQICKIKSIRTSSSQKYCGSRRMKTGCSFHVNKEAVKKAGAIYRKTDLGKQRRKEWDEKHKLERKKYLKEYMRKYMRKRRSFLSPPTPTTSPTVWENKENKSK